MYQGKFDQKKKGSTLSVEEIVASRNSAAPAKKEAPVRAAAQKAAPAAPAAPAQKRNVPYDQDAHASKKAPAPEAPAKAAKKSAKAATVQAAPKRKGPRLGGVIFYTIYFMFIFFFFVATYLGLDWIHGWLSDFEMAQPTVKAEQVFQEVFTGDIDWGALYDSAGAEDSPYEGKNEYVNYMERKVGDKALTYMETSAGLSGDKKYFVNLGEETIASFTLKDKNNVGDVSLDNLENIGDIPDWQLGAVEVFFQREEVYNIVTLSGHTAYVNGVPLTEEHTIQKATTRALDYLPAGATGASMDTQQITGLMETPVVTVTDKAGNQMTVTYDETTHTFTERTESNTMSAEQEKAALEAAKAFCKWMIEEINDRGTMAKYFEPSSKAYADIVSVQYERWMQNNGGYEFTSSEVKDFAAYGDDLFSVRVKLLMVVTRTNGTTRDYDFEYSMFFQKNDNGKWLCFQMVPKDVSEPVGKVRLTFKQGDTLLTSGFVDTDTDEVVTPNIDVGEGQVFSGWVTIEKDEKGGSFYNLVFQPDETGVVKIPDGTTLKPMTLYALVLSEKEAQELAQNTETTPAETN